AGRRQRHRGEGQRADRVRRRDAHRRQPVRCVEGRLLRQVLTALLPRLRGRMPGGQVGGASAASCFCSSRKAPLFRPSATFSHKGRREEQQPYPSPLQQERGKEASRYPSRLAGEGAPKGRERRDERSELLLLFAKSSPLPAFGHLLPQGEKGRTTAVPLSLPSGEGGKKHRVTPLPSRER